ncbi:MAG TPA: hypothetical protein VL917_08420 [Sphingomicrobium sp.]|jgi:hypothetical protein|nr:hypothetical protein [Sphingomicrobium sp.]
MIQPTPWPGLGCLGARNVITLDASHASLAARPAEVAALIIETAQQLAEQEVPLVIAQ